MCFKTFNRKKITTFVMVVINGDMRICGGMCTSLEPHWYGYNIFYAILFIGTVFSIEMKIYFFLIIRPSVRQHL